MKKKAIFLAQLHHTISVKKLDFYTAFGTDIRAAKQSKSEQLDKLSN